MQTTKLFAGHVIISRDCWLWQVQLDGPSLDQLVATEPEGILVTCMDILFPYHFCHHCRIHSFCVISIMSEQFKWSLLAGHKLCHAILNCSGESRKECIVTGSVRSISIRQKRAVKWHSILFHQRKVNNQYLAVKNMTPMLSCTIWHSFGAWEVDRRIAKWWNVYSNDARRMHMIRVNCWHYLSIKEIKRSTHNSSLGHSTSPEELRPWTDKTKNYGGCQIKSHWLAGNVTFTHLTKTLSSSGTTNWIRLQLRWIDYHPHFKICCLDTGD